MNTICTHGLARANRVPVPVIQQIERSKQTQGKNISKLPQQVGACFKLPKLVEYIAVGTVKVVAESSSTCVARSLESAGPRDEWSGSFDACLVTSHSTQVIKKDPSTSSR